MEKWFHSQIYLSKKSDLSKKSEIPKDMKKVTLKRNFLLQIQKLLNVNSFSINVYDVII